TLVEENWLALGRHTPDVGRDHVHELRQFAFPVAQYRVRALAFGQVDNIGDPLVGLAFEASCADQYRHAAAVLPEKFLLAGLHQPGGFELFSLIAGMRVLPFGRRYIEPSKPGLQILALVPDHAQKRVIGVDKPSVQVPDHDPDNIRIDQPPNLG